MLHKSLADHKLSTCCLCKHHAYSNALTLDSDILSAKSVLWRNLIAHAAAAMSWVVCHNRALLLYTHTVHADGC